MSSSLWDSLEDPASASGLVRESAQTKRQADPYAVPSQQPMRAGLKPAQQKNPTSDQKRHRRQMRRQANMDFARGVSNTWNQNLSMPGGGPVGRDPQVGDGPICPQCGNDGYQDLGNHYRCNNCGYEFNDDGTEYEYGGLYPRETSKSTTPTKESNAMTEQNTPTEAELLTRLASATTLSEQAMLSAQIEDIRAKAREAKTAGLEFDWLGLGETHTPNPLGLTSTATYQTISDRLPHATAAERLGHTDATDWMADLVPSEVDDQQMTASMRAEATHWFAHEVWEPVKADQGEFKVQAYNAGVRAGAQYGLQREAAASVFIAHAEHLHKHSEWGADPFDAKGPDPTVPTYVTDGRDNLPVGVDPSKAVTHDDNTEGHGTGTSGDPKTDPSAGDQQSLQEGSTPEHGSNESSENPLTNTKQDKSSWDKGEPSDRMNTQSGHTAAGEASKGYLGKQPDTGDHCPAEPGVKERMCRAEAKGAIGDCVRPKGHDGPHQGAHLYSWTEEFSAANSRHRQSSLQHTAACAHDEGYCDGLRLQAAASKEASLFDAAAAIFGTNPTQGIQTHADALPSNWGEGKGIDEGDEPEHGHSESPVQETPSGDLDKSSWGGEVDSLNTGGTEGGNPASGGPIAGTPTTSSLSANAKVFAQTLSRMSSLDDTVAGVSGRQVAALMLADPTVPASVKEALKAGGNPFAREAAGDNSLLNTVVVFNSQAPKALQGRKGVVEGYDTYEGGVIGYNIALIDGEFTGEPDIREGVVREAFDPTGQRYTGSKQAAEQVKPGDKVRATVSDAELGGAPGTAGGENFQNADLIVTEVEPDGTVWAYNPNNPHGNENNLNPGQYKKVGGLQTVAVAWGRRHYEDLASSLSSLPDGEREKAARHFAQALSGTNPHYRSQQFEQAASTKGYKVRGGTGTANYSRGHYQAIADAVKSYPGDKASLAKHLSEHFGSSNMAFKPERFLNAAASLDTEAGTNRETHDWGKWGCNRCGMDKPERGEWVPKCTTVTEGFGDPKPKNSSLQTEAETKAKPGEIEHLDSGAYQRSKCQHCGGGIRRKSGMSGVWTHAKNNSRYCETKVGSLSVDLSTIAANLR